MATIAKIITDLSKRAKVNAEVSAALKTIIDTNELASIEVSTEVFEGVMGGLYNLETAEQAIKPKIQSATKAEVLNAVDAGILQSLGDVMTEEQKTDFNALETTKKKLDFARNILESIKPKSSGDSETTITNLKKALEDAKAETRAEKEAGQTAIANLQAKHKSSLFKNALENKVLGLNDIAKEQRENRHFMPNFLSDFKDYLGKEGIQINHETHELTREDGTPYFNKSAEKVSLDDLIETVVKQYGYKKKSETPEVKDVEIDEKGGGLIMDAHAYYD